MKTSFVFHVYFTTLNSNVLLELYYHLHVLCDGIFFNAILANLVYLSRYQHVLNMAEAPYYILNTVW